eukprot:766677-Hanusia_phi.AAC.10
MSISLESLQPSKSASKDEQCKQYSITNLASRARCISSLVMPPCSFFLSAFLKSFFDPLPRLSTAQYAATTLRNDCSGDPGTILWYPKKPMPAKRRRSQNIDAGSSLVRFEARWLLLSFLHSLRITWSASSEVAETRREMNAEGGGRRDTGVGEGEGEGRRGRRGASVMRGGKRDWGNGERERGVRTI